MRETGVPARGRPGRAEIGSVGVVLAASVFGLGASCPAQQVPAPADPHLVVLVVVDQLRDDMLDRFSPAFEGGFRRFLDAGFRYTQTSHVHAVTETAAGHATISTGTFPSRHGIVANDWQQRRGIRWVSMYSVEDAEAPILGADWAPGRSPRNLLRSGLADWVMEADDDARVVSISAKDRAAITLAGQTRSEVYWILPEVARFVTSEHYRGRYPGWVGRFNRDVMPGIMGDSIWDSTVPTSLRSLARADTAAFEGDGTHTAFPHLAVDEVEPERPALFNIWASEQPRADRAVLSLAREAVEELDLGRRGVVDFLAISLSATDYVGHAYGPFSQEQLDNLVRADRELGAFLEFLDAEVGSGEWVAALTADHGIMTTPEQLQADGDSTAVRTSPRERGQELSRVLTQVARESAVQPAFATRLARALVEEGVVTEAYTQLEITRGPVVDSFAVLFRNSHMSGRAHSVLSPYGVEFRHAYNELVRLRGSTHGSPYWYDRHVPFILLGAGVVPGSSDQPVGTVDIAPTLAAIVQVPVPYDLDGIAIGR